MNRDEFKDILASAIHSVLQEGEKAFGRQIEMGDCLFVAHHLREYLRGLDFDASGYHGKLGPYPHWFVVCEAEVDGADEVFVIDPLGKAYYPDYDLSGDPKDADMDQEYEVFKDILDLGIDHSRFGLDEKYRAEQIPRLRKHRGLDS